MKYLEKIQELLPLGYLYLILLGLLKESIQYYQLGINILKYSSITDILISPVSEMSSSVILTSAVILVSVFLFIGQTFLIRNSHKDWAKKILGQNRFNYETSKKEIQKAAFPFFVLFLAYALMALFVGLGIGEGRTLSKKIIQNNFSCNYKINFNSGKSEDVYVFNLNSSYYFYVTKGSKNIKITPVAAIGNLELINNRKQ